MSVFENARFIRLATVLALALALLLSGVVVGAAGGPLIMGAANNAGVTNTSLTTTSTGTALLVTQTSTGTALRGVANNGIAGFFTSANGSGVSGVVANNTKYGVFGANDAATFGGGAAIRASGQHNHGVVATTANAAADALRGINTGGGQALDLVVNAGVAPMSVNSDMKVANLNADKLDGLDSAALGRDPTTRLATTTPQSTGAYGVEAEWASFPFTQPAGRTLVGLVGEAAVTVPPTCTGSAAADVFAFLDGKLWAFGSLTWSAPIANTSVPVGFSVFGVSAIASPARSSDVAHTLVLKIRDTCMDASDWTFTSAIVDVILLG